MRYTATKRKYLDSLIVLVIGLVSLFFIGKLVKPPQQIIYHAPKPQVVTTDNSKFIYIANSATMSALVTYNLETLHNQILYSTTSGIPILNASFLHNNDLYAHSTTNFGIGIQTKKIFTVAGDYISPDGKSYISVSNTSRYSLIFNYVNMNNYSIKTNNLRSDLNTILGWSSNSNDFYYTTTYNITTETPRQATDHWMQMVNNKLLPMSRIRTWTDVSTKSAEMVYQIDTQTKKVTNITNSRNLGIVQKVFYNNTDDELFVEKTGGLYSLDSSSKQLTLIPLDAKIATASTAIIFDSQSGSHRFLHSDGTSLALFNADSVTDTSLYYASNSATLTPLELKGDSVIFSLQDRKHYAGEILDTKQHIRTEFINHVESRYGLDSVAPLIFISWLKSVKVSF